MSRPPSLLATVATTALVLTGLSSACSGSDDDATDPTSPLPDVDTDTPLVPVRDASPFCQAMLDVTADAPDPDASDGSVEQRRALLDVYTDVADDVPDEIRPEYDVMVRHLRGLVGDGAGDDGGDVEEGADAQVLDLEIVEDAAIEFATYVETRCRGTSISPLPPPTSPDEVDDGETDS